MTEEEKQALDLMQNIFILGLKSAHQHIRDIGESGEDFASSVKLAINICSNLLKDPHIFKSSFQKNINIQRNNQHSEMWLTSLEHRLKNKTPPYSPES